jgi:selenocysteine lyase/cysteine desulfurase
MLNCKSSRFSIPDNVTYLNCSYMGPLMKSTEKKGLRAVRLKRNPVMITPDDFFRESELLRAEFAKLVNAPDPKSIAIIPSVSYGIATVAKNLPLRKHGNIVIAEAQFPSNYYSWEKLAAETGTKVLAVAPDKNSASRGKTWNEKILDAISPNTVAVAIAHTHWADGTKFDLEKIRARTNDVGAMLIIDGTQSVGALPFDVSVIKPDALICAGYKWLLGPYSLGVAYFGEKFINARPLEENWINRLNSEDFSSLVQYNENYQSGALRFDVGEHSNFILLPMLLDSISQLNRWGTENIQAYCKSITEKVMVKLKSDGFVIEDEPYRAHHLIGIRVPASCNFARLKESLTGQRVYVSYRGDAIRVSPNVYNKEAHLEKLYKILRASLK